MSENNVLPLGTIVSLKNGDVKLMIIGIFQKSLEDNKIYDYCACIHPFGYLNSQDIFLFNHDKIEKIYFKGYFDHQSKEFYEDLIWKKNKDKE